MSHVVAASANQSSSQDIDMEYLDTNVDSADRCLTKDK